jgi:hypothetical protein
MRWHAQVQQLVRDHEILKAEIRVCLLEQSPDVLLALFAELEAQPQADGQPRRLGFRYRGLRSILLGESCRRRLVLRAGLATHGDDERLVMQWENVVLEVVRDECRDLFDAIVRRKEGAESDCAIETLFSSSTSVTPSESARSR